MTLTDTGLPGVKLIEPKAFEDERGLFYESFNLEQFRKESGLKTVDFVQDNHPFSLKARILRGLNFQYHPAAQLKLVRCGKGKFLDVVVDIRKGSPTFSQHITQELTDENKLQLFIPRGFAHGYITLSEDSIFHYKVDQYYHSESEGSIAPDDPSLKIDWRIPKSKWIQSKKDQNHPLFQEAIIFDYKKNFYA